MKNKIIPRKHYLDKLINKKNNGLIKIVTGIRRCGKSFLLDPIFKNHLIEEGIKQDHIIKIDLEDMKNEKYLDRHVFYEYVKNQVVDEETYFLLIDEVQKIDGFESLLNSFLHIKNLEVYVTGSNSKFLSSDIVTEFRGRSDEIRVYPLTFSEFFDVYEGDSATALNEFMTYGGMPLVLSQTTDEEKSKYLENLFELTYKKDIIERHRIDKVEILDVLVNILSSSVGSLTNPRKVYNTFISNGIKDISLNTIVSYLSYLVDAFLIERAERYDIKGKKYIQTPQKYYFADIGLRNARLNFRQQEENHIMENVIYNELLARGYNVDVGVVETWEKNIRKKLEIDFVCNQGSKRYYIQSALHVDNSEKMFQETRPFKNVNDSFKKIIVIKDNIKSWRNEEGILIIGVQEFLLNKESLDI